MDNKNYLIAIPCLNYMDVNFVASLLSLKRIGASKYSILSNSLVYDARNRMSAEAIDTGADRILWLDSDMVFNYDLMEKLAADMDEGRDFVCGIFFKRRMPIVPVLNKIPASPTDKPEIYLDYPKNQIFEVGAAGFGAVMTSTEMIKNIWDKYGEPFSPMPGNGEDYSFCIRARELGYKLYCDSRIKVGHVGAYTYTENLYLAQTEQK